MSSCALRLWLTGDRDLQRQISLGVTKISLVHTKEKVLNRFPKFIENLRSLRSLDIKRSWWPLFDADDIWKSIKVLPPTLTSLRLRFENSYVAVLPPTVYNLSFLEEDGNKASSWMPNYDWTLKDSFPRLETLAIRDSGHWTLKELETLPASLTSLDIGIPDADDDDEDEPALHQFIASLPRSLSHLKLRREQKAPPNSIYPHLPRNLVSYGYRTSSASTDEATHFISDLPSSLTSLKRWNVRTINLDEFHRLPSSLNSLSFCNIEEDVYDLDYSRFKNLTSLGTSTSFQFDLHLPRSSARTLSPTVTSISIASYDETMQPQDWPLQLKSLLIRKSVFLPFAAPPNLTSLVVYHKLKLQDIALLPRSLISLDCSLDEIGSIIDFPPSLTYLSVSTSPNCRIYIENKNGAHLPPTPFDEGTQNRLRMDPPKVVSCFPIECVPPSTLKLHLASTCIPASRLRFLPPKLKSLRIKDIFIDRDFDPSDDHQIQAMTEIFCFGAKNGFVSPSFSTSILSSIKPSIATLLPRSLTSLFIHFPEGALKSSMDWKWLPPTLKKFSASSGEIYIDAKALSEIPMAHMRTFILHVFNPSDENLKALGRKIDHLYLGLLDSKNLTPKAALYLPHNIYHLSLHRHPIHHLWNELERRRKNAIAANNSVALAKLLSYDNDNLTERDIKCYYKALSALPPRAPGQSENILRI